MLAAIETTECPPCHGTGSGVYNSISPSPRCETCGGTGIRPVANPKPEVRSAIGPAREPWQ